MKSFKEWFEHLTHQEKVEPDTMLRLLQGEQIEYSRLEIEFSPAGKQFRICLYDKEDRLLSWGGPYKVLDNGKFTIADLHGLMTVIVRT